MIYTLSRNITEIGQSHNNFYDIKPKINLIIKVILQYLIIL